jgi:hypothetical protein
MDKVNAQYYDDRIEYPIISGQPRIVHAPIVSVYDAWPTALRQLG